MESMAFKTKKKKSHKMDNFLVKWIIRVMGKKKKKQKIKG